MLAPGLLAAILTTALAPDAPAVGDPLTGQPAPPCHSRAAGRPNHGRLVCGVRLPAGNVDYVSWDSVLGRSPNRRWRRFGTDKLIETVEAIAFEYGVRFPVGPRLVVGDLSRPRGGPFGEEFGGVGHASHQNGLDVDIYYPRRDGLEQPPERPALVDRRRAQWLVDRAARGAHFVFIGPHVGLRSRWKRVQYLPLYHDNHLHLRIRP